MELNELQTAWSQLSEQLNKQEKLTNEIILKMTQDKYRKKFKTLNTYETIGAVVCYIISLFILINFYKLDIWYLQLCGAITLGFLIIMPTLVLRSLKKIKDLDILKGTYRETLITYTKEKNYLLKLQQIGIAFSFLLLFIVVPVTSKIISNKNIFLAKPEPIQWFAVVVALLFVTVIARWGYRSYKKITDNAADVLKDLDT